MLSVGDIVTHSDFPPIEGMVTIVQPIVGSENRIGVLRKDTGTVYYDNESMWDVLSYRTEDGYEIIPSENKPNTGEDIDIVDAEYVDVKE